MSAPLFIGPDQERALIEAVAKARAHPYPWELLKRTLPVNQETDTLRLEDRQGEDVRPRSHVVELPPGWMVCISCEEQPAGILLHVSISDPRNRAPGPGSLRLGAILTAAGIDKPLARHWVEEFLIDGKPGGHALNLLFMDREREIGGHG